MDNKHYYEDRILELAREACDVDEYDLEEINEFNWIECITDKITEDEDLTEEESEEIWVMAEKIFPEAVIEAKEQWKEYHEEKREQERWFRATRGVV